MMTKQELLEKVHKLIWDCDDNMDQDSLFTLQELIDKEVIEEANEGNLKIKQYPNGYIHKIEIPKAKRR